MPSPQIWLMKKPCELPKLTNFQTYLENAVYFWFQFAISGSQMDLPDFFIRSCVILSVWNEVGKKCRLRTFWSPLNWCSQFRRKNERKIQIVVCGRFLKIIRFYLINGTCNCWTKPFSQFNLNVCRHLIIWGAYIRSRRNVK